MSDDEFRDHLRQGVQENSTDTRLNRRAWNKFSEHLEYFSANFV